MTASKLAEQIAFYWASGCALMFIISYSLMARWYRSVEGALLMFLATAFCTASYVGTALAKTNPDIDPHAGLRWVRASLTFGVGAVFLAYSYITLRNQYLNRHGRRRLK